MAGIEGVNPEPVVAAEPVYDDVYVVEKVVRKRNIKGEIQYLIKWIGWGSEHNTWEPIEHLDGCPEAIADYEDEVKREKKEKKEAAAKKAAAKKAAKKEAKIAVDSFVKPPQKETGFDRGLIAEKILGAWKHPNGGTFYFMKWKDSDFDESELVSSKVVCKKCPFMAIDFFEERLIWNAEAANATAASVNQDEDEDE